MKFVSPLLKNVVYPVLRWTGGLRLLAPPCGLAIVNYHGVLPAGYHSPDRFLDDNLVSADTLRKQLRFLKAHYQVLAPEEFRDWLLSGTSSHRRCVLVTCDDGLLNNLTDMLPILQEEGVRCLFFVTGASCSEEPGMLWYDELYHLLRSGKIDPRELGLPPDGVQNGFRNGDMQSTWWNAVCTISSLSSDRRAELMAALRRNCQLVRPELPERRWRLLDADALRELSRAGMTIGAHTRSHIVLSRCSDSESHREIQDGKFELERTLGRPIWAFAYPFGNPATVGDREMRLTHQIGFECAFLNAGGGFVDQTERFRFSRTSVSADMSIAELEAHMTGFHTRLQRAVRG